jgi:hypothetical protein
MFKSFLKSHIVGATNNCFKAAFLKPPGECPQISRFFWPPFWINHASLYLLSNTTARGFRGKIKLVKYCTFKIRQDNNKSLTSWGRNDHYELLGEFFMEKKGSNKLFLKD